MFIYMIHCEIAHGQGVDTRGRVYTFLNIIVLMFGHGKSEFYRRAIHPFFY
jgi:hypothetical protein